MAVRAAVAGASGYAGGEVLRLLLGHPEVEIGALTGQLQRRAAARRRCSRTCCRWPTGCWSRPPPRSLAGHDVVFLALPHGAVRRRRRAARRRTCWSSTAAPTSG